jgi:hypothetical protein
LGLCSIFSGPPPGGQRSQNSEGPMVSKKSQLLIYDFYFKRDLKGEFFFERSAHLFLFFSKENLCQPPFKTPLLTKEFSIFLYLTFERSTHL